MTLANSDNPFLKLKARNLLLRGFVLSIGLGLLLGIVQGFTRLQFNNQVVTLVIYILIFAFLCLWSLADFRRFGINLQYVIGTVPNQQRWLPLAGLVILIILCSLSAYLVSFYLLSLAAPDFVEAVMREAAKNPSPTSGGSIFYNILSVVTLVIVAPITEEFLFRGIILQRWASKWGMPKALIVSGIVFGILHANFVGLSIFGIVMGVLYIKTRTLIVPIACHAFNNAIAVGISLLSAASQTTSPTQGIEQLRSGVWGGVLLMLISLPLIVRFLWRNWPRKDVLIPYLINVSREQEMANESNL